MINSPLIELTDEQQVLADDVIVAMGDRDHLSDHPALAILFDALDEDPEPLNECVCDGGRVYAPELDRIIWQTRDSFEGANTDEAVLAALRGTTVAALAREESFWGDDNWGQIVGTIKSSDGRTRVLMLDLIDYMTGPYDWYGVFIDLAAVEEYLMLTDHIVRIEQFDEIPHKRLLAAWHSHS
ncbi:MAG: hypothetical protein O2973_13765 [Gemmatimonadetes bacterium]|nr:hypothetical protein [Gemmatimonadota bacterium]